MERFLKKIVLLGTTAAISNSAGTTKLPEAKPVIDDGRKITVVAKDTATKSQEAATAYSIHAELASAQDSAQASSAGDTLETAQKSSDVRQESGVIKNTLIVSEPETKAAVKESAPAENLESIDTLTFSEDLRAIFDSMMAGKKAELKDMNISGQGETISISATIAGKVPVAFSGNLASVGGELLMKDYKIDAGSFTFVAKMIFPKKFKEVMAKLQARWESRTRNAHPNGIERWLIQEGKVKLFFKKSG